MSWPLVFIAVWIATGALIIRNRRTYHIVDDDLQVSHTMHMGSAVCLAIAWPLLLAVIAAVGVLYTGIMIGFLFWVFLFGEPADFWDVVRTSKRGQR